MATIEFYNGSSTPPKHSQSHTAPENVFLNEDMIHLIDYLKELTWLKCLSTEFDQHYFKELETFLNQEIDKDKIIYPPLENVFAVFNLLPLDRVKIVILGQDPYHQPEQAQGIAFSVPSEIPPPPSLKNILKEVQRSFKLDCTLAWDLTSWVDQGVMLLNTVLTVEQGQANSHQNKGWEFFTDQVIKLISDRPGPVVFLLWGNSAHKKEILIDSTKNHILKTVHPSPLSAYRGFLGCKHFENSNHLLEQSGQTPIIWSDLEIIN